MKTFALELYSTDARTRIENAQAFVGADASGSFGILAGREPLATALVWGLCSLRTSDRARRQYVALPGGVLYFADDLLRVCAQRFLVDEDPQRIVAQLTREMHAERDVTRDMHALLRKLDDELLTRLLEAP